MGNTSSKGQFSIAMLVYRSLSAMIGSSILVNWFHEHMSSISFKFQTTCFGKRNNFSTPSPPKQICNFTAKTTPWFAKHPENKPQFAVLTPFCSPFSSILGLPNAWNIWGVIHLGCQFITRPWFGENPFDETFGLVVSTRFKHLKKMLPTDSESISWKMRGWTLT